MDLPIQGQAAVALAAWLKVSGINSGYLFCGVNKGGNLISNVEKMAPVVVNRIVKHRADLAGFTVEEVKQLGAHSLRAGFVTECGRRGIGRGDAMALSGHKTVQVFEGYYQAGNVENNPAAKLMG